MQLFVQLFVVQLLVSLSCFRCSGNNVKDEYDSDATSLRQSCSQVSRDWASSGVRNYHFPLTQLILSKRCYGDDTSEIKKILARLQRRERKLQSISSDSQDLFLAPAYGSFTDLRRSLLPVYGSSRRSLLPVYGISTDSRRSLLSQRGLSVFGSHTPTYGTPPPYGSPVYGSPPPYGSPFNPSPAYGGTTVSRRSMDAQMGDTLGREALHQALAFVLNKQKAQKLEDASVAGISITGPKSCPQGFRRSLKRASPDDANPSYECIPLTTISSSKTSVDMSQAKQLSKGILPEGKVNC